MIITIDGHAGAGKSTVARLLAERLGFELLNTGAMYRAVAILLQQSGIDLKSGDRREIPRIERLLAPLQFHMDGGRTVIGETDFSPLIHTADAGEVASLVGTFAEVREKLKAEQRRLARERDIVCEGRDQGTAVFPDAEVKFFVTASVGVRAERRAREFAAKGIPCDLEQLKRDIKQRDERDERRTLDPLRRAADAIDIDTSNRTIAEVVSLAAEEVERWRSKGSSGP